MSNEKFSKVSNDNKLNEQEKNISKVISNENSDKSEKNLNIPIKNISPEFNNEINNIQKIQKDKINSNNNIDKIKLDEFTENQIKALISYHLFIKNLNKNIRRLDINSNSKSELLCYLVDEKWMQNYFKFFLYNEIKSILRFCIEKKVEIIYEKLDNDFLKKIKEKEKEEKEIYKRLSNFDRENFIESPRTEDIQKYYYYKFYIINEETYNYMNKTQYKLLSDLKVKEYLINEGRIFIKNQNDLIQKLEILICSLATIDNHIY